MSEERAKGYCLNCLGVVKPGAACPRCGPVAKEDCVKELKLEEHTVEKDVVLEGLKNRVNEFLWVSLPDDVTLGRAEQIAVKIYDLIEREWCDVRN